MSKVGKTTESSISFRIYAMHRCFEFSDLVRFAVSDMSLHCMNHILGFSIARKGSEVVGFFGYSGPNLSMILIDQLILLDANHETLLILTLLGMPIGIL
jgi:hypothetical protein